MSSFTNISWQQRSPLVVIIVTYLVGIAGIAIPDTRPWFALLTPVHLLLTLGLLLAAYRPIPRMGLYACLLIFALGFGIEVLGVQSGFPFGRYTYGSVLGPKLFNTPLIIGVNWLLLALCTRALATRVTGQPVLQVLMGAVLMTGLDVLIEPVAIALGFWHWYCQPVPLQNYAAWFMCAAAFMSLLNYGWPSPKRNALAPVVYGAQVIFFTLLNLVLAFN